MNNVKLSDFIRGAEAMGVSASKLAEAIFGASHEVANSDTHRITDGR